MFRCDCFFQGAEAYSWARKRIRQENARIEIDGQVCLLRLAFRGVVLSCFSPVFCPVFRCLVWSSEVVPGLALCCLALRCFVLSCRACLSCLPVFCPVLGVLSDIALC